MTIEGCVARILDDRTLVINRGGTHGVREGMRFVIFAQIDEVADPESGEPLGKLEVVKAFVVAMHVQEKMATCAPVTRLESPSAAEDDPTQRTLSAEMIAVSLPLGKGNTPKLEVDRSAVTGMPRVGPITVGDRVRSV